MGLMELGTRVRNVIRILPNKMNIGTRVLVFPEPQG